MSTSTTTQRSLLFVTGTRADFGKIEPLAIACRDAGFKISFFITGMHMMARYGETRLEVKRFEGAEFFEFVNQRAGDAQDFILAKTVMGFSDFVHEHRPDLVVIHGDRVEAMAAAIVCAMRYIPSAHIEGGEVSGTIDESIRHCNTKLCSSHFVSSEAARDRVLSLGESKDRIFVIGSPELDGHGGPSGVTIESVRSRYDIRFIDYGVVIFHPVTSELDTVGPQAHALFTTLRETRKNFVVILPNNDPGSEAIIDEIRKLPVDRFRVLPSMRFNYFSELLRHSAIMIGNSSAGVRECPFLGIPSIDVGTRQHQRALADSVATYSAFDKDAILQHIKQSWGSRFRPNHAFGSGQSADAFVRVLTSEAFWFAKLQKVFAA